MSVSPSPRDRNARGRKRMRSGGCATPPIRKPSSSPRGEGLLEGSCSAPARLSQSATGLAISKRTNSETVPMAPDPSRTGTCHSVKRNIKRTNGRARRPAEARDPRRRRQIRRVLRLVGHEEAQQPRRQGDRLDRGHGHLPRLCAGRALHLAAQDPADQQLHLRLPLLHQPQELERPPRPLHRRGSRRSSPSLSTGAIISRGCSSPRASSARPTTRWSRSSRSRGSLREEHDFRGYIHLKTIPDADPELVHQAGLHADRRLDQRRAADRRRPRPARAREGRRPDRGRDGRLKTRRSSTARTRRRASSRAPGFAPAGQSTQMIVGADAATDGDIVARAAALYDRFRLRRVYYSAFSPNPRCQRGPAAQRPPLMREHRLYQSDWLMRFYGFAPPRWRGAAEAGGQCCRSTSTPSSPGRSSIASTFPVDVNRAPREALLRVPGLGVKRGRPHPRRARRCAGCGSTMSPGSPSRSPRCGRS